MEKAQEEYDKLLMGYSENSSDSYIRKVEKARNRIFFRGAKKDHTFLAICILVVVLGAGAIGLKLFLEKDVSKSTVPIPYVEVVEENGYKVEDWVQFFLNGEYTACDLYTPNTSTKYTMEMFTNLNMSYDQYNIILTAITDSLKSIEVEESESKKKKLTVECNVYASLDEPLLDEVGIKELVNQYKLGEIDINAYTDGVQKLINDSLYYTLRGNNEVVGSEVFECYIEEKKDELVGVEDLINRLLNYTNLLHNVSTFELVGEKFDKIIVDIS